MVKLFQGYNRKWLDTLEPISVDACVTDPPYGLRFQNKRWDYDVPSASTWEKVFRVLKPGAFVLSFFGTRTYHRGVCNLEDAGFEIVDQIQWLYGNGFPKSLNLDGVLSDRKGFGTALKPACEPIVLAQRPSGLSVVETTMAFGTGALNIDGCRVPSDEPCGAALGRSFTSMFGQLKNGYSNRHNKGRWPSNVIHDGSEETNAAFAQFGTTKHGTIGRFYYCAKASEADRDDGLDNFAARNNMRVNAPRKSEEAKHSTTRKNHHPTVKPTDLMRYLCRLVTPPAGTVLDPWMGSGSTGKAALAEGFGFIGMELDPDYYAIADARIGHAKAKHFHTGKRAVRDR